MVEIDLISYLSFLGLLGVSGLAATEAMTKARKANNAAWAAYNEIHSHRTQVEEDPHGDEFDWSHGDDGSDE